MLLKPKRFTQLLPEQGSNTFDSLENYHNQFLYKTQVLKWQHRLKRKVIQPQSEFPSLTASKVLVLD